MKRAMYACLVLGAALLAGCSSHGGGGGGGGSASVDEQPVAERPALSVATVTQGLEELGPVDDNYNGNAGLKASITNGNKLGGDGLEVYEGHSIDLSSPGTDAVIAFTTGPDGVMKGYGNDGKEDIIAGQMPMDDAALEVLKAYQDSHGEFFIPPGEHTNLVIKNGSDVDDEVFTGTVTYGNHVLVLNGANVGLEYSSFGMWLYERTMDAKKWDDEENVVQHEKDMIGFYESDNNKSMPDPNTSFTGKAMALATDWHDTHTVEPTQVFLRGDAELKVSADGRLADLTLAFDNFYDFKFKNMDISEHMKPTDTETAAFFHTAANPEVVKHGTPAFEFGNPVKSEVVGNFYGSQGASASEATGRFEIDGKDYDTEIRGTFGVKKN